MLESQLLLVRERLLRGGDAERDGPDGPASDDRREAAGAGPPASESRVRSGAALAGAAASGGSGARRVSPSCQGRGEAHDGQVELAASADDPQDGQRSAGLTEGF